MSHIMKITLNQWGLAFVARVGRTEPVKVVRRMN